MSRTPELLVPEMYRSAWAGFYSWAMKRGYAAWPAHPKVVIDYLACRCGRGYAQGTLGKDSSAIAAVHRINGKDDPTANSNVSVARKALCRAAWWSAKAAR